MPPHRVPHILSRWLTDRALCWQGCYTVCHPSSLTYSLTMPAVADGTIPISQMRKQEGGGIVICWTWIQYGSGSLSYTKASGTPLFHWNFWRHQHSLWFPSQENWSPRPQVGGGNRTFLYITSVTPSCRYSDLPPGLKHGGWNLRQHWGWKLLPLLIDFKGLGVCSYSNYLNFTVW